jgi:hypothetical protein
MKSRLKGIKKLLFNIRIELKGKKREMSFFLRGKIAFAPKAISNAESEK